MVRLLIDMDPELLKRFSELERKIEAIYQSSEKMRKIFLWTLIISAAFIILPLLGLGLVLPAFLKNLQLPLGF